MTRDKTDTGYRDHLGRTVWSGPRGGWFVEHEGRQIRVDKRRFEDLPPHVEVNPRRPPPPPAPAWVPPPAEGPLPQLPPDVLRHIARLHPRAGARLAVAGDRNAAAEARRHADVARGVGRAWRAKTEDLSRVRTILADIMKTRALHTAATDISAARAALMAVGYKFPWSIRRHEQAEWDDRILLVKTYFAPRTPSSFRGYKTRVAFDGGLANNDVHLSIEKLDATGVVWCMFVQTWVDGRREVGSSAHGRHAVPPEVLDYARELLPYLW